MRSAESALQQTNPASARSMTRSRPPSRTRSAPTRMTVTVNRNASVGQPQEVAKNPPSYSAVQPTAAKTRAAGNVRRIAVTAEA